MKQEIFISIAVALLFSGYAQAQGSPQQQAQQQLGKIQATMKANRPGTVATSATGYTMRAKVNSKSWVAEAMMPPKLAGRIVGYYGKEYIGLPYDKNNKSPKVGPKTTFNEGRAADLATNETAGGGIWGGRKGEMVITKVTPQWVEATFFFTATSARSPQIKEVTEGFLRFPYPSN